MLVPEYEMKRHVVEPQPGFYAFSGIPANSPPRRWKRLRRQALYEVLTGSVPLSQALAKDSRSGVYNLAMTRRPPKLSTMFTSATMARLLEVLKEGADLVVMDCSRAAAPEAGLLAKLGDATLLVTRKELLGKSGLAKSLQALNGSAPLAIIATK